MTTTQQEYLNNLQFARRRCTELSLYKWVIILGTYENPKRKDELLKCTADLHERWSTHLIQLLKRRKPTEVEARSLFQIAKDAING